MWLRDLVFWWLTRPAQTRSLTVGGRQRTYLVHVPPKYDPNKPLPVVLALHAARMNGRIMAWISGLHQKADEAGFLAVYPNGTGTKSAFTWNGGPCCGSAFQTGVDDVAFIRAVLDDLAQTFPVDARRVYATGLSNGAIMAYRLASELSERIAAVAVVSGTMGTERCEPKRPVPLLHFHGMQDEFIPFAGGQGVRCLSGANFYPVEHAIRAWIQANGCNEEPTTEELPDQAHDGTKVRKKTYGGGKDGAEVVLVVIEGGGHTWPGRPLPERSLGKPTANVSANDLMWEFFMKHSMKEPTGDGPRASLAPRTI
jgi:polyhydroxybutyrate depolymerase